MFSLCCACQLWIDTVKNDAGFFLAVCVGLAVGDKNSGTLTLPMNAITTQGRLQEMASGSTYLVEAVAKITHHLSPNSINHQLVRSGSNAVGVGAGGACNVLGVVDGGQRRGGKMPEETVSQFFAVRGGGRILADAAPFWWSHSG